MNSSVVFQRGDIVQLSNGGPIMAVEDIEDKAGKIIRCKWFDGNAREVDSFYADALQHYVGPNAANA